MGTPSVFELMLGKIYGLGISFEHMTYFEEGRRKAIYEMRITIFFVTLFVYPRKTKDNKWISLIGSL